MSLRLRCLAPLAVALACEASTHRGPLIDPQAPTGAPTQVPTHAEPPASPQAAALPVRPSPQRAWHLAARVEVDEGDDTARLRLLESADGTLFVTSGPLVMRVGPDGSFAPDRAWLRGIESPGSELAHFEGIAAWDVETLGGRLPDGLYMSLRVEIDGRAEPPTQQVYRWAGTAWTPVDHAAKRYTWQITALAPWRDGSVLALRSFTPTMPPEVDDISEEYYAEFLEIVARQRRLVVLRGKPKAPTQLATERILAFDARETGEIVAIVHVPPKGVSVEVAESSIVRSYEILHYAPDRPLRRVSFPELTEAIVQWQTPAVAWNDDGVLRAWGSIETTDEDTLERTFAPLLLRFDGEQWIRESAPPCREGSSIVAFATDVERQWAACKGHFSEPGAVLTRVAEGPWEEEIMPDDAVVGGATIDIVVRGPNDVWIASGAVYRTQPVASPVALPGLAAQWSAP